MPLIIIPRANLQDSSSGEGGQTFSNAGTLSKLATDKDGNLTFDGKTVGEKAVEVAYSTILSKLNISACSVVLPDDCDTSRGITVALQGIATQRGVDWEVNEKTYPELDAISWQGLGIQAFAQEGDALVITYYKKL